MNHKQKSILSGRKPKHCTDTKPTLDDAARMIRGVSPLVAAFKWLAALEAIQEAQLRYFQLAVMPVMEERIKQHHPNCVCTWEDVQPLEPTITIEPLPFAPDDMDYIKTLKAIMGSK